MGRTGGFRREEGYFLPLVMVNTTLIIKILSLHISHMFAVWCIIVSTQPQAATHWLVRDLFKLTAEASASHLSSYA
jgi:hypothetical protein